MLSCILRNMPWMQLMDVIKSPVHIKEKEIIIEYQSRQCDNCIEVK